MKILNKNNEQQELKRFFKDKRILVTGGCGSIGSEIVRQLLNYNAKLVRVLDNNETGLFDLYHNLEENKAIRIIIGDVRDKDKLIMAMENIDIVFHAAAYKHVHYCEYSPFEAVKTNVLGTQNVIEAARENLVNKTIFISTDKAVNPVSTMGASKLLAERLVIAANHNIGYRKMSLSCVRFGNVMHSRGSVIPYFINQIKAGGPVTMTHPEMTRFMMSIHQAANLVLKSAKIAVGGEIFVLKMPVVKIQDLAEVLIQEFHQNPEDVKIKIIGPRPGEKYSEQLMSKEEQKKALETDDMFILLPQIRTPLWPDKPYPHKGAKPFSANNSIDSAYSEVLTKEEIREMLRDIIPNELNKT